MNCNEANSLISSAVDGELDESKQKDFYQHIRECDKCRAEYKEQKSVKQVLQQKLRQQKAPAELIESIKKQTSHELYKHVDQSCDSHAKQLNKIHESDPINAKTGKLFLEKLSRMLFIEPYGSKINHIFAIILGSCILAMLVFAGFVKSGNISILDLQKSIFNTPYYPQMGQIINQTGSSFDTGLPTTKTNQPGSGTKKLIESLLHNDNTLPKLKEYSIVSIQALNINNVPAVKISYIHNANRDIRANIFAFCLEDVHPEFLDKKIMESIQNQGSHVVTIKNKPNIVLWKKNNIAFSAISNQASPDLQTLLLH